MSRFLVTLPACLAPSTDYHTVLDILYYHTKT